MTRKEKMDFLLSKVPEDQKEAFLNEFREAKTKEDRISIGKKYNMTLTKEELNTLKEKTGNKLSDEELDAAAGGCGGCSCSSDCSCS